MQNDRPKKLIGVLGTHTEVGKTWVSSQLLTRLRQSGLNVAARKPVQSFDRDDKYTDASILASATGEAEHDVCPPHRRYPIAMAPPMASDRLGEPRIALDDLLSEIRWSRDTDIGLVETVGGPLSPLSHDGDSIDLLRRLQPDMILLIADAGLGTLNAVRLSLPCAHPYPAIVFLNRYDERNELHRMNRHWLAERYGVNTAIDIDTLALALTSR